MNMDPDVVEIPPPIHHHPSKFHQLEKVYFHDVIHIDDDDNDSEDVVIIGEKVTNSDKGKTLGASSNSYPPVSHTLIHVDGHDSNLLSYGDYNFDIFPEDYMDVDEYVLLQSHFDEMDIPAGIKAPFSWLPGNDLDMMRNGNSNLNPWSHHVQSNAKESYNIHSSQPLSLKLPTNLKIQGSSLDSSNVQTKKKNVDHSSGNQVSSTQFFSQAAPNENKLATSIHGGHPFQSNKKPSIFDAPTNHGLIDKSEALKLAHAAGPPYSGHFKSAKKAAGSSSSHSPNFIGHHGSVHPPGIESGKSWWTKSNTFKPASTFHNASSIHSPFYPQYANPEHMLNQASVHDPTRGGAVQGPAPVVKISDEAKKENLRKYQNFKQFDTVEDTSDHYFVSQNASTIRHPKKWAKKIQEEWKILEKDLPDSIFVRVYESRMDLLRAVIIGAEGTPYHDGLFFFDVFFPSAYPDVPPKVHYHSGGLRLNPNLYNCGKVCLSLLNTWNGSKNEKWVPGVSTILQVLVSIQGLILNTKPYFNEPGYAHMSGSTNGEMKSLQYNEDTFILSLRTMMYMIRKPPKSFEGFVLGHFCSRARDILVACKAYMEGAQVGCLVKGGVQDVDEGDRSCSKRFKDTLSGCMSMLVIELVKIGANDIEKFLHLLQQ
ncbi:hypothetical protein RJT34_29190 [Clitoria ternatea]|uniref:E2 ubiquitin-conjugating enzyme n=1 Tax=Clitoria ternatea TaxID=43366 RepID=A0AAN9FAA2_CLITE